MRYLYLFVAIIFFQNIGFSQKQLSHFVYPVDTISSFNNSYSFPENEDAVFLSNNSGAYIITKGQTSFEPVKIADALIAKEFVFFEKTKSGQGFLVVKDPYGNYHVGGGDIFKPSFFFQISGQLSYKPIFKVIEGNILFTDEDKLYSADIEGNIKVMAEMPLIKSFAFDGKNLALINLTSFLYNDTKIDLNKVWQTEYSKIDLFFYKSYLYAYNNSNFWIIEKKKSKITSKSITNGLTIVVNIRNDSLIVGSAGYVGIWSYHVDGTKYTKIPEPTSKPSEYVNKWQGDSMTVNLYCQSINYACINQIFSIVDLKNKDLNSRGLIIDNLQYNEPPKIATPGIKYLGNLEQNYYFLYLNQYGLKRLIIYDREIFQLSIHSISNFKENEYLIYQTKDQNLLKLIFKPTSIQYFTIIPKVDSFSLVPTFVSFKIGNKNFAYGSPQGDMNLYQNFLENDYPQKFISSINVPGTKVFLNDTVYKIPSPVLSYPSNNFYYYLRNENPHYVDFKTDTLKFTDLKTEESFKIFFKGASSGAIWFIPLDTLLYVFINDGLFCLKNKDLILIKEGLIEYSLLNNNNKLLIKYKLNEKNYLALVEGTNFREIKVIDGYLQYSQSVNDSFYFVENNGNSDSKLWKIDKNGPSEIHKFWNNLTYYTINFLNKNLYVFNVNHELFSNITPFSPIVRLPDQIINLEEIYELGSTLYFSADLSKIFPPAPNNSNTPRFLIKFDIESKKFFYLKSTLINNVKRLELLDERLRVFGENYPNNQILIDKDGPSLLTGGFTKIYDSQVKDNRIYVFGSYQNLPPQLYELNSSKPFDYEWVEIKDEPVVTNPEDPTDFGKVIVYPNPVIDDFDIKYQNVPGIYHIAIFNEAGQEMFFRHAGDIIDQYEKTYLSSAYLFSEKSPRQNITDIIKGEILSYPPGTYYLALYFDTYQWKKHSTVRILKVGK